MSDVNRNLTLGVMYHQERKDMERGGKDDDPQY